ncbi:MAG TPA: discoidin domain-containing protein [Solirubrobacteraceae bacterium]|nr:discoidin domain-containing protein [Solirubrobacteraceae bacterium]
MRRGRAWFGRSVLGLGIGVIGVMWLGPAGAMAASPCPEGRDGAGWTLATDAFANDISTRHAYVGNGYLSQRVPSTGMGYIATGEKTGWPLYTPRYDGAFVAGLYGADPAIEEGRTIDAAIPTWSTLALTAGSETLSPTTAAGQVSNYRQALYLGCGLLRTSLTWTSGDGRATDLVYEIVADRANPHVGVVHMTMVPHWNGPASVTGAIDGAGARRLVQTGGGAAEGSPASIEVNFATQGLDTAGTVASTLKPGSGVKPTSTSVSDTASTLSASQAVRFNVKSGRSYELTKFVGVDTALTSSTPEASAVAASRTAAAQGWNGLFADHGAAWADLWKSDITVADQPELQDWIRANLYALWSSIRSGADDSISPVGLSSDNYAGLIFWDAETWMYPSLLLMHPDIAESIVELRRKTLPGALQNAAKYGYKGTLYPWNGAGTGDLDQECHSWNPPHCLTQIHLQGDIALSVWQYYLATGDTDWLRSHWSIMKGIAEFWAKRATDNGDGSYSINNVAGPDEYSNGVNDGVFTNAGAATALRNATKAAQVLGQSPEAQWTAIADHVRMPFDDAKQVFLQYDGYAGTLIKQADTVLLIYPMEWPMSQTVAANTLDYYAERTDPDGPAMTDAIHAVDSAQIGEPGCATNTYLNRSIKPFVRDPFAQFAEARGDKAGSLDPLAGSPAYDFLTGAGGFAQVFTYGLTGFRWRSDRVHLDPMLPPQLSSGVTLRNLHWQGRTFDVHIGASSTTVTSRGGGALPIEAPDGMHDVSSGSALSIPTRRPDLAPTSNVARCRPATASSEEAGMYAEAAVDGSNATIWAPDQSGSGGNLAVDLGARTKISGIDVQWTDARPASSSIQVSLDGSNWTSAPPADANGQLRNPVNARYVRVTMTVAAGAERTGIRELVVTNG